MNVQIVWNSFKMLYILFYYISALILFLCHFAWFCCVVASTSIPWLTLILIIICVASKFIKLNEPETKAINELLGIDPSLATDSEIDNTNSTFYWPIAHRGAYFDVPENSAAAIKKCHNQKYRMVLLNLELTKCGELVILHKSTLEKANITDSIGDITFESLQNISITDQHPLGTQFEPEKILSLANLIRLLDNIDLTVFLLISPKSTKCINAIKTALKSNELLSKKIVFCSSSVYVLYQLRKAYPNIVCGLWMNRFSDCGIQMLFRNSTLLTSVYGLIYRNIIVPVIGISIVFISKDEYNAHIKNLWKLANVRPIVYHVNSPNEKRYFQTIMKTQYLTDSLRSEPQQLLVAAAATAAAAAVNK